MASIGISLEKLITGAAKGVADLQIGVNKILWGNANTQPAFSAKYDPVSGSLQYTAQPTQPSTVKQGSLLNSGLYNALDALNSVDLCNIITYTLDTVNLKKLPRPSRETWGPEQEAFYFLQDQCFTVRVLIDKYTAFPNTLVSSYLGTDLKAITNQEAVNTFGTPLNSTDISGTSAARLNTYNLILAIQDIFQRETQTTTAGLFTPEEKQILNLVPGLAGNVNFIDDFLGFTRKYTDYRTITNADLLKLQNKISQLRSICVAVEALNIKSAAAVVGNFLNIDIRAQIQELSKYVNPTKIIPTLRQIVGAVQSFVRVATRLQGIIKQAQFIIKVALLVIKVFKFVQAFILALPLGNIFTTVGIQAAFDKARGAAEDTTSGLIRLLKEINALLSVVLIFVRYLLVNANEILIRLRELLAALEGCDAMKDSEVLAELRDAADSLENLRNDLAAYITQYDSKTNPNTALFGQYEIKVVDEEVVERAVTNKRRRGIALDKNGFIVTQSDLTFATNTTVIIEEVKIKLISAGLVQPSLSILNGSDLAVISVSLDYLDSNDVLQDNLNLQTVENLDSPDNEDESKGTGLNAFLNKLPGGRSLRKRTRAALNAASDKLKSQVAAEGEIAASSISFAENTATSVGTGGETPQQQAVVPPRTGRRNR
jgi:hypothetical protein